MDAPRRYEYRSDESAAKRFSDALNLHRMVLSNSEILAGRFVAVGLGSGECDGPYDTREEAWRHNQNRPERLFIFPVGLERLPPQACDVLLWYVRRCYDNGWREDGRHALWIPGRNEELRSVL